ncbi:MAG: inorganic phosphate transporter [Sulfolobales archaeon]
MDITIVIGVLLMLYIAWSIGANDAANPTSCVVGAGVLNIKKALILFSIFVFLGSVLQGWMVMKTFGGGVTEIRSIYDAIVATLAAGIWITLASYSGMPISTTHSAVGGVLGIGLAHTLLYGYTSIRYDVLLKVVISWITSPLSSILLTFIIYKTLVKLYKLLEVRGLDPDKVFRYLAIFSLAFSAYSFGANDVSNSTGVYVAIIKVSGYSVGGIDIVVAIILAVIGALGIIIGGFTVGAKVITTVALKITRLDLISGVAAGLSNALVVWVFTTIPYIMFGYGMPISTTHAAVSAVIGAGLFKGRSRSINKFTIINIVSSWLLTVPLTALIALGLRILIHNILNV